MRKRRSICRGILLCLSTARERFTREEFKSWMFAALDRQKCVLTLNCEQVQADGHQRHQSTQHCGYGLLKRDSRPSSDWFKYTWTEAAGLLLFSVRGQTEMNIINSGVNSFDKSWSTTTKVILFWLENILRLKFFVNRLFLGVILLRRTNVT